MSHLRKLITQMPHTVTHTGEVSLFERLANNHAVDRPTLLQQQYRMHPGIAQFPSDCFYGGRVHDGVSRFVPWPNMLVSCAHCTVSFEQCNLGIDNARP